MSERKFVITIGSADELEALKVEIETHELALFARNGKDFEKGSVVELVLEAASGSIFKGTGTVAIVNDAEVSLSFEGIQRARLLASRFPRKHLGFVPDDDENGAQEKPASKTGPSKASTGVDVTEGILGKGARASRSDDGAERSSTVKLLALGGVLVVGVLLFSLASPGGESGSSMASGMPGQTAAPIFHEETSIPPATPVGDQLGWILRQLTAGSSGMSAADIQAHFASSAFDDISTPDLMRELNRLGSHGPYTLLGFTRPPTATTLVAGIRGDDGTRQLVRLTVQSQSPNLITTLRINAWR